MSFVEDLDVKILKNIKFKCRVKATGMILPVKQVNFFNTEEYGFKDTEVITKTEEEYIKEHLAKGGHYCDSCGTVFYDDTYLLKDVDLIIEEIEYE